MYKFPLLILSLIEYRELSRHWDFQILEQTSIFIGRSRID